MKKTLEEFKAFAMKGNVVDMAVGVIIGTAFGKIVSSLVNDIVMPPIGRILGGVDFKHLYWNLSEGTYESLEAAKAAGAATVNYGIFINQIIDFLIVAFTIFLVIKGLTVLKKREAASSAPAAPPAPPRQELLLEEIRDLLKKKA
jgi:large conductance mechanosensitive channel